MLNLLRKFSVVFYYNFTKLSEKNEQTYERIQMAFQNACIYSCNRAIHETPVIEPETDKDFLRPWVELETQLQWTF